MKIASIDYTDQVLSFTDGDYVMSHITQTELKVRVIQLQTDDGSVGWGELARKPAHDPAELHREPALLAKLVGKDLHELTGAIKQFRTQAKPLLALAYGLETAYLDCIARKAEIPLYGLLGGKHNDKVPEYYSLGAGSLDTVASTLQREALDWPVVQIKLGTGNRQADCAKVRIALESLGEDQTILADFNGALNVESALSVITQFDDQRLVWEEPCNNIDANTRVAEACGKPIMFDQCLTSVESIIQVAMAGVAHSVCIKPPFLGGLEAARVARDACIEMGVAVRIDGPWCSHISTAAILHLACGVPSELLVAGCDLRQPLVLNDDWGGTEHLEPHFIKPSASPGHGATPN
jgi:cis-L-3-hydroxyproline dehydratase